MAQSKWNPWFWGMLLIDPGHTLDLVDKQGKPDHGKLVPFFVIVGYFVAHFMGKPLQTVDMVVVFSAAFGYGMFRTFLNSKTFSRTETQTKQIVHTITEKRDHTQGIDPA